MTERPEHSDDMEGRQLSHSQNFLRNPGFVRTLVERSGINQDDYVVEIGPGKGIITAELSEQAGHVIGVEMDHKLATNLRTRFSGNDKIEIIEADFLRWNLPEQPYKVFANIPFNMTADMINKLLLTDNPPQATYLIMQDQAAGRFMGPPYGTRSQMSTLLRPFYNMGITAKIDRKEFSPVPNVNAVLAKFEQMEEPKIPFTEQRLYRDFVVYGYNQWKPTLSEAFNAVFSSKQQSIMERNLRLKGLKPTEVDIDQWIGMFETFIKYVPDDKKRIVIGAEQRLRSKQTTMQKEHRTRDNRNRRRKL